MGIPLVGGVDLLLITCASINHAQAYPAAICAILGSVGGSAVLFGLARKGGEALLLKHTSKGQGARLRRWFESYGLLTVFIPAISPIPMPMKIPVFCSGALGVRWSFFMAVVVGARDPPLLYPRLSGHALWFRSVPFHRPPLANHIERRSSARRGDICAYSPRPATLAYSGMIT